MNLGSVPMLGVWKPQIRKNKSTSINLRITEFMLGQMLKGGYFCVVTSECRKNTAVAYRFIHAVHTNT